MSRKLFASVVMATVLLGTGASAVFAAPPPTWDNLVVVKSKRLDAVYILPGADFRPYKRFMIDPTEVAFKKNWKRDYNSSVVGLQGRISESDLQSMIEEAGTKGTEIFAKALREAGYEVATEPGPDVLRMRTGVINISVNAPERNMSGRSRTYSEEAGDATLVIELRDSQTGAILARGVDRQLVGDTGVYRRTSVSNRADFRDMVGDWAKVAARGLAQLQALASPAAARAPG